MSKDTILKKHLDFKRTSVSYDPKIKDIERALKKFLDISKKPFSKFTEEEINKFINTTDVAIRTMNDYKSYIKVFIKWYFPDWSSRFRNLDRICKQQKPPRTYEPEQMLSYEEIERIVKTENDLMWKVYWLTLFYGGFRPTEACKLKWNQVFFENKGVIIKLHATKTGKDFYKSLPEEAEQLLKELKKNSNSEFIFPSPANKEKPIDRHSVWSKLKYLSKRAIGREVNPYCLRHSVATLLYSNDKFKDDDIAQQMGHSKDMRETYKNMSVDKIKEKARELWVKTKDLTPTEREKLEKEIEEQKKKIELTRKGLSEMRLFVKAMVDAMPKREKKIKLILKKYE